MNNGLLGLHQAHDKNGKALGWDGDGKTGKFNGQPEYIKDKAGNMVYKEATITVFAGNFDKPVLEAQREETRDPNLTKEESMVKTFSHEVDHNTNQDAIDVIRDRQQGRPNNFDVEAPAEDVERRTHDEIIRKRSESP